MNREEKAAGEEIGWHVIARGGDMTARVHGGMCLGQGPSGEISFEPVDGIVGLTLEGNQLKLTALRAEQELLVPDEQPARAVLVSPQTHVSLTFGGHTLDVDNDFAQGASSAHARTAGGALHIEVIDANSSIARAARGPASAGRRLRSISEPSSRTIVVAEAGPSLWTSPADHMSRPDRQGLSPEVRRPLVIGGALLGVVTALLALAIYLPSRLTSDVPAADPEMLAGPSDTAAPVPTSGQTLSSEPESGPAPPEQVTGTAPEDDAPVPAAAGVAPAPAATDARLSDSLLARFTVLIRAERLPDRGTVDFVIESLRSLQLAYPNDARIPEALNQLALKLLDEARTAYEAGDALQAGRLIELAVTTGAAPSAVDEALAGMTRQPQPVSEAGNLQAAGMAPAPAPASAPAPAPSAPEFPVPGASPPSFPVPVSDAAPDAATGLDALVHQATGVSVGALAVDPATTADPEDQVLTLMLDDGTAAGDGQEQAPAARDEAPDALTSVDRLPVGFALEDAPGAAREAAPTPPYRPFDELTITRRAPLVYPATAPRRRSGSVDVSFTVNPAGEVTDVSAESDLGDVFVNAARDTISRWRFEPVLVDGVPTVVRSAIRVTFRD
ncbi:MAG: energy transducer TonB [Pseudomonadales bacterium]